MKKIKSKTIIDKYNALFDAMFFDDFFVDKYAVLFDRLIARDKIEIRTYYETDSYVQELSIYINNYPEVTKFVLDLPCDIMFDLYYRYHILMEYLYDNDMINVSTYNRQQIFIELFTETWFQGITTFSRKHF